MEIWDIYDKNKKLTGRTMQRNDWNMADDEFHLTVQGVIRRPDGKFLITKRTLDKSWAPGYWEVSGGGVQSGETSEEAVKREILEETGIDVSFAEGGFIFDYKRENHEAKDNYFVDIYRFDIDVRPEDVKLQLKETSDFKFASAEEIKELGKQGIFLHYDSIKQVFGIE